MKFTKEQLPVRKFEQLGLDKKRLQKLSGTELDNLLSGYPSNMKLLRIKDASGKEYKVNAKVSIYRTVDGHADIMVHPFRPQLFNDLGLTTPEVEQLNAGNSIVRKGQQGTPDYLVQLDRQIHEIRKVRLSQIHVRDPSHQLSRAQIAEFKSGKTLKIKDAHGREREVKIDLGHARGYAEVGPSRSMSQEIRQEQKLAYDHKTSMKR